MGLFQYLQKALPDTNRTQLKQLLKYGCIRVNQNTIRQFDHPLKPGDQIQIRNSSDVKKEAVPQHDVDILYEDGDIIVVNKPSGLLTISTEKEQRRTLFFSVNDYLNKKAVIRRGQHHKKIVRKKQVFIVHRLDKGASGVIVFAKREEIKLALQENWQNFEKTYYAVVEGTPEPNAGVLESWLTENTILRVYSGPKTRDSKWAITHYRTLKTSGMYSLLEVLLVTGRKHQIRVQLSDLGCPIAGDKDYGAKTNPAGRLALHAFRLQLIHPVTGEKMNFKSDLPMVLGNILKQGA